MKILFVVDCYNIVKNGTSATAQRFANELRKQGHQVKILGIKSDQFKDDPYYYGVDPYKFPIFQFLMDEQGFCFARSDEYKVIVDAIKGSDVVHLFMPFPLEQQARLIAKKLSIPVTCAFHIQPENISSTIYLGKSKAVNKLIYRYFYLYFYQYIRHVQVPSKMMGDQLKLHHYDNNVIHPISNGVLPFFMPIKFEKPEELKDKIVILMIGRLSREKRQDLIIKAIGHSKYNDKIQLILCGQGPNRRKIEKLARKYLKNPLMCKFVSKEELRNIINYSDIYIHASDAESEAIACIEAFSCGLVPIISDSPISATNQFALDKHLLFRHGKYNDLKDKIEYLIEHPDFKEEMSKKYLEYSKEFRLDAQVKKLLKVFELAIEEHKNKQDLPSTMTSEKDLKRMQKLEYKLEKAFDGKFDLDSLISNEIEDKE